jgi:metal-responsive CopG/Arc/MetJ family transcriptional regulator
MPEFTQANVNLTVEDARALDWMANEDGIDNRSAFVRKLIRQEWSRRYSRPNPGITIEQAQAAAQSKQEEG